MASAATAARHKTCDSQKQNVQLKRQTRHCYWHEYRLKLRGNDGSMCLHLRINPNRCAREEESKVSRFPLPKASQAQVSQGSKPVPDISAPCSETTLNLFLATTAPPLGSVRSGPAGVCTSYLIESLDEQQPAAKGRPPIHPSSQPNRQLGAWEAGTNTTPSPRRQSLCPLKRIYSTGRNVW